MWLGEKPCRARKSKNSIRTTYLEYWHCFLPLFKDAFPPDNAPKGRAPVGVRPFSWRTDSDSSLKYKVIDNKTYNNTSEQKWSYLSTEKTLAIFPIALILFLMTSLRSFAWPENTMQTFIIFFNFSIKKLISYFENKSLEKLFCFSFQDCKHFFS